MKTRILVASALVLGMIASAQAATGGNITNTRHNLGVGGVGVSFTAGTATTSGSRTSALSNLGDVFTTGTDQICVFCHTPHGAVANPPAPLWNKGATGSSYKAYTMGGNMATGGTDQGAVAGMSLACLTCHDGTQAMDNMANFPGRGGDGTGGANGGTRAKVRNEGGAAEGVKGDGYNWYIDNTVSASAIPEDMTAGGAMSGLPYMLGTDLSNDHPIGMVYGGGLSGAGVPKNPEFSNAGKVNYNGTNKFYVADAGSVATWGDNANFKLYGDTMQTAKVECGTCHDPHIDSQALFLRRNNTGSAVCLSCHIK